MASRMHAHIERRRDRFVLVDHSSNGTFLTIDGEPEIPVAPRRVHAARTRPHQLRPRVREGPVGNGRILLRRVARRMPAASGTVDADRAFPRETPSAPNDSTSRTCRDDYYANPYPYYRALREHAPVKRMPDGVVVPHALRRHPAGLPRSERLELGQEAASSGPSTAPSPLFEHHTTSLVFNDPPLHTRVRRAIVGALSQRHIAAMEPGLVALVDAPARPPGRAAATRRPDRRIRRRDPGRDHRQPARRAARRARAAARAGRSRSSARSSRC